MRRWLPLVAMLVVLPAGAETPYCAPLSIDERQCVDRSALRVPPEAACRRSDAAPTDERHDLLRRREAYERFAANHRVNGLASYYSKKFDGRKTANGETFRNNRFSAAHLTLPLGTWIEVKARATGRSVRLRVNDRGPFARKFVLDLSQAAARHLGVDVARDRHVEITIVALPGEEPLPDRELPNDLSMVSR